MKEPRSIKEILLDIAEKPDDDFGRVLRKCPSIQKGLEARRRKGYNNKKKASR